ncbi:hypothetical protein OG271_14930 [Micromonospora rifamycinica]|uniref:hypothetical protein n=1 Tax=Micromonospora rifamycinica TaxID=291594 RepID=UPI002E2BD3AD|nr:hypothetical protein [Micromonospora rifamycinica]
MYSAPANRAPGGSPATISIKVGQAQAGTKRVQGRPTAHFDPTACRQRHPAECGFNQLEHRRATAATLDHLAVSDQATLRVVAITSWLRPEL